MLNTLLVRMVKCKDEFRDVDGLNIRLTFCLPGIASCLSVGKNILASLYCVQTALNTSFALSHR